MHHLIIFGPQGSGKGTQAQRLAERLGLINIGAGDILREIATEDTPRGRQINEIVNERGELVPDGMINEIFAQRLGTIPPNVGFILDGWPRNIVQAEHLKRTLQRLSRMAPPPTFIYLEAPMPELLERLRKRHEREKRADDTPDTIARRLKLYEDETRPILEKVTDWAHVITINGNQPVAAVTEDIQAAL